MCYAVAVSWIAARYIDVGWTDSAASVAAAAVSIVTIPAALIVPALSDRGDRRSWLVGTVVVTAVGMFGLAFVPTVAPWVWILTFSAGAGSFYPLILTLPLDLSEGEEAITEQTAWMLGLGYLLSAAGPIVVGALRDLTGSFTVPLAAVGVFALVTGVFLGMHRTLRREEDASGQGPPPDEAYVAI